MIIIIIIIVIIIIISSSSSSSSRRRAPSSPSRSRRPSPPRNSSQILSGIFRWIFSGIFQRAFTCRWCFPKDCHLSSGCLLKLSNGLSVKCLCGCCPEIRDAGVLVPQLRAPTTGVSPAAWGGTGRKLQLLLPCLAHVCIA